MGPTFQKYLLSALKDTCSWRKYGYTKGCHTCGTISSTNIFWYSCTSCCILIIINLPYSRFYSYSSSLVIDLTNSISYRYYSSVVIDFTISMFFGFIIIITINFNICILYRYLSACIIDLTICVFYSLFSCVGIIINTNLVFRGSSEKKMPQSGLGSMQGLFWTHKTKWTNETNACTKPYIEAACCLKKVSIRMLFCCMVQIMEHNFGNSIWDVSYFFMRPQNLYKWERPWYQLTMLEYFDENPDQFIMKNELDVIKRPISTLKYLTV